MQVAHFLEADLRPWSVALAAALFAPDASPEPPALSGSAAAAAAVANGAAPCESPWQCLDELRSFHGAVDAVLRASRLPLLEQLPRTPAEWQPVAIGSRAVAGALELSYREAAACCDAMHAVRGVQSLCFYWSEAMEDASGAEAGGAQRACSALASLSTPVSYTHLTLPTKA